MIKCGNIKDDVFSKESINNNINLLLNEDTIENIENSKKEQLNENNQFINNVNSINFNSINNTSTNNLILPENFLNNSFKNIDNNIFENAVNFSESNKNSKSNSLNKNVAKTDNLCNKSNELNSNKSYSLFNNNNDSNINNNNKYINKKINYFDANNILKELIKNTHPYLDISNVLNNHKEILDKLNIKSLDSTKNINDNIINKTELINNKNNLNVDNQINTTTTNIPECTDAKNCNSLKNALLKKKHIFKTITEINTKPSNNINNSFNNFSCNKDSLNEHDKNNLSNSLNQLNSNIDDKIKKRSIKNNKIVYTNKGLKAAFSRILDSNGKVIPNKSSNIKYPTSNNLNSTSNKTKKNIEILPSESIINQYKTNNNNNNNISNNDVSSDSKIDFSGNDNNENNIDNNRRGSRYRGVSRNGNQWQVLIMVCKKKRYVGSYSNEEEAARAYDKASLQNHGVRAKTNYDYVDDELRDILSQPPILKLGADKFTKH